MSEDHSEIPEALQASALALEASFQSFFNQSPLLSPHARVAFETLETLGKGGMGTVYAVRDRRLDREAALKLLSHAQSDADARARFLREAKITAKLDHPAIPAVYETGLTPDGQLYMLMKRIRGRTLKECIRDCHEEGSLSINDLISVLIKVAEAIAYAHRNGILHRDLKPDNIMVGEFGEVLVIDWGIAKDLHSLDLSPSNDLHRDFLVSDEELERVGVTVSGSLVGTPGYMAPEQIEGSQIDFRVDIFALGANLTEILTGEKAVAGESAIEKIAATVSDSVSLPRDLDSSISAELNWIAKSATHFDRAQRTESAEDFISQLKAYLAGKPVPGYRYSLLENLSRALQKNIGLAMGLMVGALTLALTGNLWLSLELEGEKRQQAEKKIRVVNDKLDVAENEAQRAKDVLDLQNKARDLARRKVTQARLQEAVDAALSRGTRTEGQLLAAAQIYQLGDCPDLAIPLVQEAVRRFPPCYRGLFELHKLELGNQKVHSKGSMYLLRLISEAKKRGDVNEFVLFSKGVKLQQQGKHDEALKVYAEAEQYSTSVVNLYNNRGVIWKLKKKYDKALADFGRCLEIDPEYAAAHHNRGLLWVELKKFDKAVSDFKMSIQFEPKNPDSYSELGMIYSSKGELDKAALHFDKAISLSPNDGELHCFRGINHSRRGDSKKALRDFDRSLALIPNYALGYYNRAGLFLKVNQAKRAIEDVNRAIKLNPKVVSYYTLRGRCWQRIEENKKAIDDFSYALELNSRELDAYFYRGVLYHQTGNKKLALRDYRRVIDLNPEHYDVHYNRGILWKNSGEIEKAFGDFNKTIELQPRNYEGYLQRAKLAIERGLLDAAFADLSTVIKLAPRISEAYYERSVIYRRRGQFQLCLDDLNQTIQLSPNWAQPYGSRATLRQHLKQFDKALEDVNLAINKKINRSIIYAVRAEIYAALGKNKEAIQDYERFLQRSPKHPDATKIRKQMMELKRKVG